MRIAKKTKRRVDLVDRIIQALRSKRIYNKINVAKVTESTFKQFMYHYLLETLEDIFREQKPDIGLKTIKKNADEALLWEGDIRTVINNFPFLGTQHRPDFEVRLHDLYIGVEVKRGDTGHKIREGLGQSLVYANKYDFVIYLFADTSRDKKIVNSIQDETEHEFLESLWKNYNICFEVV